MTDSDPSGLSWLSNSCMAITAGAGSIGCAVAAGAVGGAVSNLWRTKVQKKEPFTWKGFITETALGAASGAIGGGALGAITSRIAPTATAAAASAIRSVTSAATQRATQMAAAVSRNRATAAAAAARQRITSAVSSLKQRITGTGCSFAGPQLPHHTRAARSRFWQYSSRKQRCGSTRYRCPSR